MILPRVALTASCTFPTFKSCIVHHALYQTATQAKHLPLATHRRLSKHLFSSAPRATQPLASIAYR